MTLTPIEIFASYRPDRSEGAPWRLGHGRYLVITRIDRTSGPVGTVFEATDGSSFVVRAANTCEEAEAMTLPKRVDYVADLVDLFGHRLDVMVAYRELDHARVSRAEALLKAILQRDVLTALRPRP